MKNAKTQPAQTNTEFARGAQFTYAEIERRAAEIGDDIPVLWDEIAPHIPGGDRLVWVRKGHTQQIKTRRRLLLDVIAEFYADHSPRFRLTHGPAGFIIWRGYGVKAAAQTKADAIRILAAEIVIAHQNERHIYFAFTRRDLRRRMDIAHRQFMAWYAQAYSDQS